MTLRAWSRTGRALAALGALAGCGLVVGTDDKPTPTTTSVAPETSVTTRATRTTQVSLPASVATTAPAKLPAVLASGPFAPGWRTTGPFVGSPNDANTSTVPSWCGRTPGSPNPIGTATTGWRQTDTGPPTMLVRAEKYSPGGGDLRFAAVAGVALPCDWTDAARESFVADAIPGPATGGNQAFVRITNRTTNAVQLLAVLQQRDDVMVIAVDGSEASKMEATLVALAPRLRTNG